jgi:hypothetical protein
MIIGIGIMKLILGRNTKMNLVEQYIALLFEKEMLGELSQDQEAEFCDKFDVIWFQMTDYEMEEVEKYLSFVPETVEDLGLIDRLPDAGGIPREPV